MEAIAQNRHLYEQSQYLHSCFRLNETGVSYAAQGWHLGDGVTLDAEIVHAHNIIFSIVDPYRRKQKQPTKPAKPAKRARRR